MNPANPLILLVALKKQLPKKANSNYPLAKSLILLVALVAFQVAFFPMQLVAFSLSPVGGGINATHIAHQSGVNR